MDIVAALFVENLEFRQVAGGSTRIDITGAFFSEPVAEFPAHMTPHLVVLVRDLPKAGTIVDAGVASGADQVSGPTFSRSDKDALYRDALRAALAQARAKAQALAEASHVALGSVTKVEEQTDAGYVPFASDQQMYSSARAVAKTPIAKGRQKTEATVDVTFAIA